jgi:hypothetical protein
MNVLVADYQETILLAAVHCHAQLENEERRRLLNLRSPSLFEQRLNWDNFCNRYGHRAEFKRHMRMSYDSFNKLVDCLRPQLQVDNERAEKRGGAFCQNYACTFAFDFWQVDHILIFVFLQAYQLHHCTG